MSTSVYATDDKDILLALQLIQSNMERKISVKDLLVEIPLSRRLLEIRFKRITGESIYQYIPRVRVEHFAELLLSSNDSVVDIAYSIGVPSTVAVPGGRLSPCGNQGCLKAYTSASGVAQTAKEWLSESSLFLFF